MTSPWRAASEAGTTARRPNRHERLSTLGARLASRLTRRLRAAPPDLWFTYHLYHKAPDWLGPAVAGPSASPM